MALPAGLGASLAAGLVTTLGAFVGALLARLLADLAHLLGHRGVVLQQRDARPTRLDAGQAGFLAAWAVAAQNAFAAGPEALVAGLDARLLGGGIGERERLAGTLRSPEAGWPTGQRGFGRRAS